MEQRKLILPAFHGERMERLDRTWSPRSSTPRWAGGADEEITLHPRLQALTLEIILRAVFGLDPGPRLDAHPREPTGLLAYGDSPLTPDPGTRRPRGDGAIDAPVQPLRPAQGIADLPGAHRRADRELIAERRAGGRRSRRRPRDAARGPPRGRHRDDRPGAPRRADDPAGRRARDHGVDARLGVRAARPRARGAGPADRGGALGRRTEDYLLATIRETLRRRPVLPNCEPRFVAKPITVGGWDYEPGSCALVPNAYLLHHDPDIYPEPYAFRPERFLDTKPGTYTWIPFGGGRRRCIGMSFAMLEMRVVLRSVLRSYELTAPWPTSRRRGATSRSARRPARTSAWPGARARPRPRHDRSRPRARWSAPSGGASASPDGPPA